MRCFAPLAVLVLALAVMPACGGGGDHARAPGDLRVVLAYRAGSVPPPYHEEYRVEIGPGGRGRMELTPDYPQSGRVPVFTERFQVDRAGLDALWGRVRRSGLLDDEGGEGVKPGGGGADVAVVAGGQRHAVVDRAAEPLVAVVRPAVPRSVRAALEAKRERYALQRYRKRL